MITQAAIRGALSVGLLIVSTGCQAGNHAQGPSIGPDQIVVGPRPAMEKFAKYGSCIGSERSVDMSQVSISKSRTYRPSARRGHAMTIKGDQVEIDLSATEGRGTVKVIVVPLIVGGDPDVELRWARYEGSTFLYWRETYQHRAYRQGLLKITDRNIEPLCEGRGGSEPQHHWGEVYILRHN